MSTLSSFLIGIAGSLAARVLLALGISIVSFAALNSLYSSLISQMQSQYNSLPATTLQLANLGGMGHFLAMVSAAFIARLSLMALKKFRIT
jgi:hypothetical protein